MGKKTENVSDSGELTCGLVMPISPIDGCSAEHWVEVKSIISDAVKSIDSLKFTTKLVSDQDDVGVIQKRIVQNIFDSDIVICDVSCKNANVMFELGMRLAFDKPTILIKDDQTDFSFDTSVIEHLVYPRDLRFSRIVTFKNALADKVVATYNAAKNDPNFSTFLKHFGSFTVASIEQAVYTPAEAMFTMIQELSEDVGLIRKRLANSAPQIDGLKIPPPPPPVYTFRLMVSGGLENVDLFLSQIKSVLRSCLIREVVMNDHVGSRFFDVTTTRLNDQNVIMKAAVENGIELTLSQN